MGALTSFSARVPTVSAKQMLAAEDALVIDLRTPAEFAIDHVPGAVHLPLFGDFERAIIGTLYSRSSPEEAFAEGIRVTRRRIETLVEEVAAACDWEVEPSDLCERVDAMTAAGMGALDETVAPFRAERMPERPVIFHCWRGGLRSRSVTGFVRALGLDRAVALEGGYKGYREAVRDGIDAWRAPRAFVLRGGTGVGKSLVLRELAKLRPEWVLDLESLAGHRGSILGGVGLAPCTQKAFESRLFARSLEGFGECVVFEGESRKIGDVILPRRVWEALDGGTNLELAAPLERRIDVLVEEYLAHPESRAELRAHLPFLETRLGPHKFAGVLTALLDSGRERELVELLLVRYYDLRYGHSGKGRECAARFDASEPARCAREIASWIEGALERRETA
jgi:tRNA 2-selenouridine synthase